MFVFDVNCPNKGLGDVMMSLDKYGVKTDSRNGPVIRFPEPVCLQYKNLRRRLVTHPDRDANHFFHLFETLWMLAGSDLVQPLDLYNSGMKQYSDDGVTFAAPYGYRWRKHFGFDQLVTAVNKLKLNPADRRIVIQMWDPAELRKSEGKDFACNQQILLDTVPNEHVSGGYLLDMTVTNRSNDLIYGAMGSNLVHFSLLHEWLAYHADLAVGTYYQISKNMHLYLENETSARCWDNREEFRDVESPPQDRSFTEESGHSLLMPAYESFVYNDLEIDLAAGGGGWLETVALPICEAYRVYKLKSSRGIQLPLEPRVNFALAILSECKSEPLKIACSQWLLRRLQNSEAKRKVA